MSVLSGKEPAAVWRNFELISSIPHPSKHEGALIAALKARAEAAGLQCRQDAAGNLRIDRAAQPGGEKLPRVIVQGHVDMVPQADHPFDFVTTPITLKIVGDRLYADGTTLGADDGIGVALAMALILDPASYRGALAVLCTVSEEIGLVGAAALDPKLLEGDYLFNLDNCEDGCFCIGCAGSARTTFTFVPQWEAPASGVSGVKITIKGMPGGHSGECIHLRRGNAIRYLAEFLERHPEIAIAEMSSDFPTNAIPLSAFATGAATTETIAKLQLDADLFAALLRKEFDAPAEFGFVIETIPLPGKVWRKEFRKNVVTALSLCPDGVFEFDDALNVTRTSSNLASIRTEQTQITVATSQRSIIDDEREKATQRLVTHFALFEAAAEIGNVYFGWGPDAGSPLQKTAMAVWNKLNPAIPARALAIHGGIEIGWFCRKNPALQFICAGPDAIDFHTPRESVGFASVERYYAFLLALLKELEQQTR